MSKSVTIRLPDEDHAELERLCEAQGLTISDALKEAVRRWLGREVDPPPERIGKRRGGTDLVPALPPKAQIVGTEKGASKHAVDPLKNVKGRRLVGFDQSGGALYR